jgi:D-sedoheptulose 7-phosphate isomerase
MTRSEGVCTLNSITLEKAKAPAVSQEDVVGYYGYLSKSLCRVEVTDRTGASLSQGEAVTTAIGWARATHAAGGKLMFIGNGGSAGICSHMATDYSKNGGMRSLAFNDGSMLTCLGNDLGYENVFAKQLDLHAVEGDLLIAISSGGKSRNILEAVGVARRRGCSIVTLSGFGSDNPLRKLGDMNFYLGSDQYGYVEVGHLAILHAILDFACGLKVPQD